ncbi:hypothetical protein [Actinoplanes sp. NPDC089786]|uniref:hypothetical protein n=1 Tax=Actinoplanes sp. NPDC089786 TaxID=3155185 RepID=UPI003418E67C
MDGTGSEHLRETVVRAVIPLLSDPALTTARIARTVGVEEADLPPEVLAEAFLAISGLGVRLPAGQVVDFFRHGAQAGD